MYNGLVVVSKIAPIAINAGKIMLSVSGDIRVENKLNLHDVVTEYDARVQSFLIKELKVLFPLAEFVGEEEGVGKGVEVKKGEIFIIDPIDGTANFVNSVGLSAISIAYLVDGKQVAGVVYNPYYNEIFYAESGKGAFLNQKPIHCGNLPLERSFVSIGSSTYYEELYDWTKKSMMAVYDNCMDFRRFGSAALELCYVASGRLCAFYEARLCTHDFAAGSLIARESGAICTAISGEVLPMDKQSSVLCANPNCYEKLKDVLLKV